MNRNNSICHKAMLTLITLTSLITHFTSAASQTRQLAFSLFEDVDPTFLHTPLRPSSVTKFNDVLYFTARNNDDPREIWIKDSGLAPTSFADVNNSLDNANAYQFKVMENNLYFTALNKEHVRQLWRVNANNEFTPLALQGVNEEPLHVIDYLVTQEGIYLMGKLDTENQSGIKLWFFNQEQGLSLMDETLTDPSFFIENSHLFIFKDDLFVFINDGFEQCLLRRYPNADVDANSIDIPCDSIGYPYQVVAMEDIVYLNGVEHLLSFNGTSAPEPAFSGGAPDGSLLRIGEAIYVAADSSNRFDVPSYVYRIEDGVISNITDSTNSDGNTAINVALAEHDGDLYFAENFALFDGEDWVVTNAQVSRLDSSTGTVEQVLQFSSNEAQIINLNVLMVTDNDLCLGGNGNSLFCMYEGEIVQELTQNPLSSSPSKLTVVDDSLFYYANRQGINGIWHSRDGEQAELVAENYFELHTWNSNLMLERNSELFTLDAQGVILSLTETISGMPENIGDITYGRDAIYLTTRESEDYQVWQFDGLSTVSPLFTMDPQSEYHQVTAVGDELYVSLTNWSGTVDSEFECGLMHYNENALQMLHRQENTQQQSCHTKIVSYEQHAFAYFEFIREGVRHSSLAKLEGSSLQWWWQEQPRQLGNLGAGFVFNEDILYFCSLTYTNGIPYSSLMTKTLEGDLQEINRSCIDHVLTSAIDGTETVYASDERSGLYRLGPQGLTEVTGPLSSFTHELGSIAQLGDDLIVSARFSDGNGNYGNELVRVSPVNNSVSFTAGQIIETNLAVNHEGVSLGQMLATEEPDVGDTLRWEVVTAPQSGSLNGLPLELVSDGTDIFPDAIIYVPAQDFNGVDTFQISVTDGLAVSVIDIAIEVSDNSDVLPSTEMPTTEMPPPASDSSGGGSLGWFLIPLCILLITRRRKVC